MKKTIVVLAILLILTVMVSGCASKKETTTPNTNINTQPVTSKPGSTVTIAQEDIPAVSTQESITIEEPDFTTETNVDLGSLI